MAVYLSYLGEVKKFFSRPDWKTSAVGRRTSRSSTPARRFSSAESLLAAIESPSLVITSLIPFDFFKQELI
ncbi:MAG TPA: hypothetical protein ENO29_05420 [Candidatus Aminicenantes bacterium]|nr:hypothetical protein [Candidatus Aminicenantes bacterium]